MPFLGTIRSQWHSQGQAVAALPAPHLAPAPLTSADGIPATWVATLIFSVLLVSLPSLDLAAVIMEQLPTLHPP